MQTQTVGLFGRRGIPGSGCHHDRGTLRCDRDRRWASGGSRGIAPGEHGLATALVEQELVGGECAYWACIPSKTLLRPGEARRDAERSPGTWGAQTRWSDVAEYRDYMIRNLDDEDEVEGYEEQGIRVFKGRASLHEPGTVRVGRKTIRGDRVVIATGSEADIPEIEGLAASGYWTNREATTLIQVPESAIVLGGGPVGIELAQMLRRFGAEVDLFEASGSLLEGEDPRVGELILAALRDDGIRVHLDTAIAAVSRDGDLRVAHHANGQVRARQLIVAVGRKPRVDGLTLESVGSEPTRSGIPVDERCRAAVSTYGPCSCGCETRSPARGRTKLIHEASLR
ncbi:MAG: FAD-dependent oxidoreductase [Solirubrobacteraceae bacterium]